jgi:hypothetical protein
VLNTPETAGKKIRFGDQLPLIEEGQKILKGF